MLGGAGVGHVGSATAVPGSTGEGGAVKSEGEAGWEFAMPRPAARIAKGANLTLGAGAGDRETFPARVLSGRWGRHAAGKTKGRLRWRVQ